MGIVALTLRLEPMGLFGNLFSKHDAPDSALLKTAVDHAVSAVEPLLKQTGGYPDRYLEPVSVALDYARLLAHSLPGPVQVDRETYAKDAFVHALFPDANAITDAITTSVSMREYLRRPVSGEEFYALMGMRRVDKRLMGMELAGATLQRDVVQQATYFISHTLESPSLDESRAREEIATRFFQRLVGKVKERIEQRRKGKEALLAERNTLMPRLRFADETERANAEVRMTKLTATLQSTIESLEPDRYLSDFEAVLLHPEEHLRLNQTLIKLDNMGIRRATEDERGNELVLSELVGYDRREWTVTLVRCSNLQFESFAKKLDNAYRYLSI